MKRIVLKYFMLFAFVLVSSIANAQCSIYSELIEAFGEYRISSLKSFLAAKDYVYDGYTYDKKNNKMFWLCKNCTINKSSCLPQSTSGGKWYAYARVEDEEGRAWTEFYTNSYETWAATKESAVRNEFMYEGDDNNEEYKCSTYFNVNEFMYMDFFVYKNDIYKIRVDMAGE